MTAPAEAVATVPAALEAEAKTSPAERLATGIRGLRTRTATGALDRWLLVAGGILLPLGIVFVILGWVGAARTPLLFEQIPYVISGGLLGASLVFCGGFIYFAYWQAVEVRDGRAQHRQLLEHHRDLLGALERIESALAAGPVARTTPGPAARATPGPAARATPGPARAAATELVATEKGSLFHRPDCPVVTGRGHLRTVTAGERALRPCAICDPLGVA